MFLPINKLIENNAMFAYPKALRNAWKIGLDRTRFENTICEIPCRKKVWKPLASRHVLKILWRSSKRKVQKGQCQLTLKCAWGVTNSIKVRHGAICQQGGRALKGEDIRWCASKDAGL